MPRGKFFAMIAIASTLLLTAGIATAQGRRSTDKMVHAARTAGAVHSAQHMIKAVRAAQKSGGMALVAATETPSPTTGGSSCSESDDSTEGSDSSSMDDESTEGMDDQSGTDDDSQMTPAPGTPSTSSCDDESGTDDDTGSIDMTGGSQEFGDD